MDPLDHVIADIHGISIGGHYFDAKGVFVTDCFKGLVPPARTLEQGRTNWLRSAAIDVINNWFHRFAYCCAGIFLLQAVTCDVTFGNRLTNRRREIQVHDSEVAGARIRNAWFETGRRQLNKRVMLADGDRLGRRHNLTNVWSRLFAGKSQSGFDFRVPGKILYVYEGKRRAAGIQPK